MESSENSSSNDPRPDLVPSNTLTPYRESSKPYGFLSLSAWENTKRRLFNISLSPVECFLPIANVIAENTSNPALSTPPSDEQERSPVGPISPPRNQSPESPPKSIITNLNSLDLSRGCFINIDFLDEELELNNSELHNNIQSKLLTNSGVSISQEADCSIPNRILLFIKPPLKTEDEILHNAASQAYLVYAKYQARGPHAFGMALKALDLAQKDRAERENAQKERDEARMAVNHTGRQKAREERARKERARQEKNNTEREEKDGKGVSVEDEDWEYIERYFGHAGPSQESSSGPSLTIEDDGEYGIISTETDSNKDKSKKPRRH